MPIYEYRCERCTTREERIEASSAPRMHDCPSCGAPLGMQRQLSAAAVAVGASAPACGTGGCSTGGCPFA